MPYFDDSADSAERRDPNLVGKLCQPLLEGLRAQIRKCAEFEFHVTQAALLPPAQGWEGAWSNPRYRHTSGRSSDRSLKGTLVSGWATLPLLTLATPTTVRARSMLVV